MSFILRETAAANILNCPCKKIFIIHGKLIQIYWVLDAVHNRLIESIQHEINKHFSKPSYLGFNAGPFINVVTQIDSPLSPVKLKQLFYLHP